MTTASRSDDAPMRDNGDEEATVERIDGHRGLGDDESQAVDAAYLKTLVREHGEEMVSEARERWLGTLRAAGKTIRPAARG